MQCRSGKADRQLSQPFVTLGGRGRKPRVEHERHLATAPPLVLPHDGPGELCRRAPVDPAQAVAALPWAEAIVISLADSALRMAALVAELLRLQQIAPRRQQAAQARRDDQLIVTRQRHLCQY